MRLLVISHTPHYRAGETIVGWAPTIRELDHLATRFEHVRHVACLHPGEPPSSAIAYRAANIELVPVPPAGAEGLVGKLDALRATPTYAATILRELRTADVVHVRAPANIAMVAMLLLGKRKTPPRWFKYAGNWQPDGEESVSYTLQRWWLRRGHHGGVVTVNGAWPDQAPWIRSFYNPSLEDAELAAGERAAAAKQLTTPVRLLYVGQLLASKGAGRAIEILERLRARGIAAQLEIVGDGPERAELEALVQARGLSSHVQFTGWQPPAAVHAHYAAAHFIVLPSLSEGWPKVLSEGMAFGAVPLAGAVSSIGQYLESLQTGAALPPLDIDAFAERIAAYVAAPETWVAHARTAVAAAERFSYRHYLASVDALLASLSASAASSTRR